MERQPYIYTLPEAFVSDTSVPMRWKLYALVNGFWIGGKTVFASNKFFAEKLGCSERHIQNCLEELEKLGVLERTGISQNRKIVPKGTNPAFVGGRTQSSKGDEPSVHHTSVSNSDSINSAFEDEQRVIVSLKEEGEERATKSNAKYPHAKEVFAWFPKPQASWMSLKNVQEREYAEYLYERGEKNVKRALTFYEEYKDEPFCPKINKPSDLEKKWLDLTNFAKKLDA